jgi:uncharacterized protein (TIGR04255 family)
MAEHQSTEVGTAANSDLPNFKRPPVNETALSLQFTPIAGVLPYLGLYWAQVRSIFERAQVFAPLPNITELLDVPLIRPVMGLHLTSEPMMRYWLLKANDTELVQLQNDRFIYNWRQVTGKEKYPRYPAVRRSLEEEWRRFCDFLRQEKLSSPEVNQCEVTYVNHVEYGSGWKDYGDLHSVVSPWSGDYSNRFLPSPERVSMEAHYRLPSEQGRLHISVDPVVRVRDSKEVLQVVLTARGAPKTSSMEDILEWMDIGRRWVVRGFVDFTTRSMHKIWGLEHGDSDSNHH